MMAILLVDRPYLNYLIDIPSIIVYTLLAVVTLNYYSKYQYKGFLSISAGIFVLAFHYFLRLFFFLFLQETNSSTPEMFLRLMLLSWGLSFALMLHGIFHFRYRNNEILLLLVYLFYGAFMGLSLFLQDISITTEIDGSAKFLVVPDALVVMTTIIHLLFVFELVSISISGKKQFHHVNRKSDYWLLTVGATILIIWLSLIFHFEIFEYQLFAPFIPLIGFSLWFIGLFKNPNYLFYPKYIPHVLFVSRMNGTLIYHHDFLDSNELNHQDNFPNFSLISGLFTSLRIASTEIFSDYNDIMYYNVGKSTAVIYQYDNFLITLLVNQRIHLYETLLRKFANSSDEALNGLKKHYTINLCEPVQVAFGLTS